MRAMAAALLVLGLAACGGSDKPKAVNAADGETTTTEKSGDSTDEDTPDVAAFADEDCQFYLKALSSSPLASSGDDVDFEDLGSQFEAIADKAPKELKDDFKTLGEFYSKYGPILKKYSESAADGTPDPETLKDIQEFSSELATSGFAQAAQNISTYFTENCSGG
jgi:hypothetical protein